MPGDKVCLCAQRVQHACELDGDVARAYNCNALGLVFEGEEPIRVDSKRRARYLVVRRDDRMATCGEDDLVSVDGVRLSVLATNLDVIRRCEFGVTGVVRDTFADDILVVDSVQEAYVCVALRFERGPVELLLVLRKVEVITVGGVA